MFEYVTGPITWLWDALGQFWGLVVGHPIPAIAFVAGFITWAVFVRLTLKDNNNA